jgi:archaemetzincin
LGSPIVRIYYDGAHAAGDDPVSVESERRHACRRQGPPRPGEWRAVFPEEGQTFDDYAATCANRRGPERAALYLRPLGEAGERFGRLLELLREYAEAFFQVPARLLESLPAAEGTLDSTRLLEELSLRPPADALGVLGVTDRPLGARGMKFVFGESRLGGPAGVASLARLATPDAGLFLRRALRLTSHEIGHLLGIRHCVFYECVMQGANSLAEADRHPLEPCPVDARKLQWNLGFDPWARERALEAFFRKTAADKKYGDDMGRKA